MKILGGSRNNRQEDVTSAFWLRDKETVSTLKEHIPVMKLMQAIAFSLERQGESVVADF